jgi:hypothetical protein
MQFNRFILLVLWVIGAGGASNLQAMHAQPDRSCTTCALIFGVTAGWTTTLVGDVIAVYGLNKGIDLGRPAQPSKVIAINQHLAVAGLVLTVTNGMTAGLLYQAQGHWIFATIFGLNFLGSIGTTLASNIWTWIHQPELENFSVSEITTAPIISMVGLGVLVPSMVLGLRRWYWLLSESLQSL